MTLSGWSPKPDVDFSTCGSVLDRVRDEVEEQLTQPRAISHDRHFGGELKIDRDTGAFAENQRGLVDVIDERLQLDRLAMNVEAALRRRARV